MATLSPIAIAAEGKGIIGMLKRAETIRKRYGLTAKGMERTLFHFVSVLNEFNCGATFPITTATLARSRGVVEKYQSQKIEFAAHGYYHRDHTLLSFNEQLEQFVAARQIFEQRGIRCDGFRSPYLRSNPETLAAIKQAGFAYDSSQALAWAIPDDLENLDYRRALAFYGAVSYLAYPALPRLDSGLVRIPYGLPDDEAFVDRFRATPMRMAEMWLSMLNSTYGRGEVFTVALHPERIVNCQQALRDVLRQASHLQPRVWMTQLYQIAQWWKAQAQSEVRVESAGDDDMRIDVHGPKGQRFLARRVQVTSATKPWDDVYVQVDGPTIRFRPTRRPFVGVSPAVPPYLRSFLRQQGYIVEPAENGRNYSYYIDRAHFVYEDERALLEEIEQGDLPLVRLCRWPDGAKSALCVTGDIDALTIWDYALRMF